MRCSGEGRAKRKGLWGLFLLLLLPLAGPEVLLEVSAVTQAEIDVREEDISILAVWGKAEGSEVPVGPYGPL